MTVKKKQNCVNKKSVSEISNINIDAGDPNEDRGQKETKNHDDESLQSQTPANRKQF